MLTLDEIRGLLRRLDGCPADYIESETLDCKEWTPGPSGDKVLRETVVCLANQRGGVILLGVADRKRTRAEALTGVPSSVSPAELVKRVYDGTQPHIHVTIEEVLEPEGRLFVVRVPSGGRPFTTSEGLGKIRVEKECKPLTGQELMRLMSPAMPNPGLARGKQVFSTATGVLRATAGEMYGTSDGATSALPGVLWYHHRPDWVKLCERFGEFDRQRGRFRPYVEPALFDGSDEAFVSAAEELLRLYLWSAENHPDFQAIRAKFGLPDPGSVRSLLNGPSAPVPRLRPRLVMESVDDGKPIKPSGRRFLLENRGTTDALNIAIETIVLPRRTLSPGTIRLLKSSGAAVEVLTEVAFTDRPGPVHEYDRSLGDALSNALRTLEDPRDFDEDGAVKRKVRVSYADPEGNVYEQFFVLRFNWALERFEPVEILPSEE